MANNSASSGASSGASDKMVTIEFVEEPITLRVDMRLVTWGDLLDVQRLQREGGAGAAEEVLTQLVSRITGQDARLLPAMAVAAVMEAVQERAAGTPAKN